MKLNTVKVSNVDFVVYGIKRGGSHAIINWVLRHFRSSVFYNCCFVSKGEAKVWDGDVFVKGDHEPEVRVASFEDLMPESEARNVLPPRRQNILVLRDFYTTYASRFQKRRQEKSPYWIQRCWARYDDKDLWKSFAREFIGDDEWLGGGAIKINYNLWFSSRDYRIATSRTFGNFTDEGLEEVHPFGGGSSFDMLKYNRKAQAMKVLKRWVKYYNDKEYVDKIIRDEEAKDMNKRIFGFSIPKIHA